jgi:hypothetical protein
MDTNIDLKQQGDRSITTVYSKYIEKKKKKENTSSEMNSSIHTKVEAS